MGTIRIANAKKRFELFTRTQPQHSKEDDIQQLHIMIDEAPDSPRCAAIYYWGGGEEESKENYSNLSNFESTFHKRTSHQRRRPAAGKIYAFLSFLLLI